MRGRSLSAALAAYAFAFAATALAAPGDRSTRDLVGGWRFRFGGDEVGVTGAAYDDSAWQSVTLPHTWNRLGEYGLKLSASTDNRRGIGWYRLNFDLPKGSASRRQFLQFNAVGNIADVWVNSVKVGHHEGAFSRFRYDVTAQMHAGRNLIVLKADNSKPAIGSTTENVIPLNGDFFINGGPYRMVTLIETDTAQIDLLDHGGPGVYVSTPAIRDDSADVDVRVRLRNAGANTRALTLATSLVDAAGKVVARDRAPARLAQNATIEVQRTIKLDHPRRWNGLADPYQYSIAVELRGGSRVIDRVEQKFGVRSFRFDANEGFFLNGKRLALHGASRHQDRLGKGWALSPQDHAEDMAIMREMGVNSIRGAHYQHAQDWYDLADSTGMIMWAEIPFVHQSSLTHNASDAPTPALIANAKEQLAELIAQNYNHPSIVIWSVGNESDLMPTQYPGNTRHAQSKGMLQALHDTAKALDPSRATGYADCCEDTNIIPNASDTTQVLAGVTDTIGYNRYWGWYYGEPADLGKSLDDLHARHPGLPISVSEYGAGGATSQHTDDPRGGPICTWCRPHPEEYESWLHEESWKAIAQRPWLYAAWIWNMFDFPSDLRQEGDAMYLNDKGLVTFDRKTRKDVFYFYQAQWSNEPMLHLTGKRYVDRAYAATEVRAYSNAGRASLRVNGEARGEAACADKVCVWHDVALKPGANQVEVSASISGKTLSDAVEWNAPDANDGIRIRVGSLAGAVVAGKRFGSDAFFDGGQGHWLNLPARPDKITPPQKTVAGASEAALYGAWREGAFKYRIPLPNGKWKLTLHCFEPDEKLATTRTFSVAVAGKTLLSKFSPAQEASGALKAVVRSFPIVVKDGALALDFLPEGGPAVLSAIAIERD